jgi:hypothetical protein
MTTCLQTVEIVYPQVSDAVYQGLELKPVCPREMLYSLQDKFGGKVCLYHERFIQTPTGYKKLQGEVWFYPDTSVEAYYYDVLHHNLIAKYIWWAKPTLEDAIIYKRGPNEEAPYFRFHADGSVEAHAHGSRYYFGPDQKGRAIEYYKEAPAHYCEDEIKSYNRVCDANKNPCKVISICGCDGPYYEACEYKTNCLGYEFQSAYGKQFHPDRCSICGEGLEGWLCDTCAAFRNMKIQPTLLEHGDE